LSYKSDSLIGRASTQGPSISPCLSGGLWDAGAGISVGGRHIANWLIGQVRDKTQTEENMRRYAREIGADEEDLIKAFREVPVMSRGQFGRVAQAAVYTRQPAFQFRLPEHSAGAFHHRAPEGGRGLARKRTAISLSGGNNQRYGIGN